MQMCQLSRLPLVGSIDFQTPECVITEIIETHGCQVRRSIAPSSIDPISDLIRVIHSTNILNVAIHPHLTPNNLPLLARFVNPQRHTWTVPLGWCGTVKTLFLAYDHLNGSIQGSRDLPTDPIDFGPKTPDHPLSYDACMLYSLCQYYQIRTSRSTTLQQMALAIQSLLRDPKEIRETVRAQVERWPLNRLIEISISEPSCHRSSPAASHPPRRVSLSRRDCPNLALRSPQNMHSKLEIRGSLSTPAITDACQFFNASVPILRRLQPESIEEAVVLAAKIYDISLIESANPILEHQALKELGSPVPPPLGDPNTPEILYQPIDPIFQNRYLKNPEWYQIRQNWVPELSGMYDQTQLTALTCAEGYSLSDLRSASAHRLLQFSRENRTFYSGKSPYVQKAQSSIYLEDLDDLQHTMCFSYGIVATQTVVVYTVAELVEHFRSSRSFSNPQNVKELFPSITVEKLKIICRNQIKSIEKANVIKTANQKLLDTIEFVELCNCTNSAQAQALNATYLNCTSEEQNVILTTLYSLLELSMYMRGWQVARLALTKYPITAKETVFDSENQGQVFLNVTCAIRTFEAQIGHLNSSVRDQFNRLPLVRVISTRHGCNTSGSSATKSGLSFQASSQAEHGLSILDRVQIVKSGDSEIGSYSCIRLSSNWLAASAWYYLLAIGQKAPFEIELLSQIS